MKRLIVLTFLLASALALTQIGHTQSRPRRVGQAPPAQQPTPTPNDQVETTAPIQPTRPPVLGGANRDPNEQQPAAKPKDAGPEEVGEGDIVKVDTTLVSIPVSVMDRDGKYVPDLQKENFRIWENGVEQKVAYFVSTEKPFTVALMLDTSGSVRFRMDQIQDAAISFVNQLRPDDQVMVVSFDDRIQIAPPTNDRSRIRDEIRRTHLGSGTKLYEAVHRVMDKLNQVEGRKAIVLFTDGVDTTSRHASYESTVAEAEELDALIYPVEFDTYSDMGGFPGGRGGGNPRGGNGGSIIDILGAILNGGGMGGGYPGGGRGGGWPGPVGTSREEYERGERYLNDLARVTGARLYDAEKQNLDYAFQMVAEELRRQYSLGYYPKNVPQTGERRTIKVRVDRPELVVRTRDSYVFKPGTNASIQGASDPAKAPVLKKNLRGDFR